jgi:O-antigen/teichoic acid export membrane protein
MAIKANVAANFAGQAWRALLSFAFVPIYIRYLGVESYGVIGLYAVLQAWLALLDMGLRPALGREMARFTGGDYDASFIRDLLRSVEVIGLAIAAAVFLGVWAASGWLARSWLSAQSLSPESIAQAIAIMGGVSALAFLESIYLTSIVGLERQVLQNIATGAIAALRYIGAIAVLAWLSPTVQAYFFWQLLISLLSVSVFAVLVYRILPPIERPARFSLPALRSIWKFAGGMLVLILLGMLLTQIDKTLLSKLLTLEQFGYYVLAGNLANVLYMLAAPVSTAVYPRMTQLAARGETAALTEIYHQGAQLTTVLAGAAALMLIFFGDRIVLLWTADAKLTANVAPLLQLLACGTLLNGLSFIPYHLQLAHGWTALTARINTIAVMVLLPAILLLVPAYGAIGAAAAWAVLNVGYVVFQAGLMHRRLLPAEKWRWYREDIMLPLAGSLLAALAFRAAFPQSSSKPAEIALLSCALAATVLAGILLAPQVRRIIAPPALMRAFGRARLSLER